MSSLFWFRPAFMGLLLLAESFFVKKLNVRRGLGWRLPTGIVVCLVTAFLIPYRIDNCFYQSFMFLALFGVTVGFGVFLFAEPLKNLVFCAIAGYTVQHIASELCEIVNSVMTGVSDMHLDLYDVFNPVEIDTGSIYILTAYMIIYVWTYLFALKFVVPKVEKYKIFQTAASAVLWLSALVILVDVVVSSVTLYLLPLEVLTQLGRTTSLAVQLILHGYNILCCSLAIILIIELPRRSGAENELKLVKQLNSMKRAQYEIAKNNVELLNMKCHDLKYRSEELFEGASADSAREMKRIIDIYDSVYKTESEALNIVLTEKSLLCRNENINLSVIADASKLAFMKDSDVYTLFGNVLDNAIEAVRKVENGRSVGIELKTVNSFLIVNVFNPFAGEIKMINGFPQTTKSDANYHGYGLKSIDYLVRKYGGEMTVNVKEQLFSLTMAFQIDEG